MQQRQVNRHHYRWIGIIWFTCIHLAFALPTDQQQTLHLQAGSADLNQQTHRGVFLNNVILDQGSTHIRAATALTISNAQNKLIKAILKGNKTQQAHYWTQMTLDKPLVHAYGDAIYFYPERHLIKLIGHARVQQGKNSFTAPRIIYDTEQQHVISKGNQHEPTMIIFYPEKSGSLGVSR